MNKDIENIESFTDIDISDKDTRLAVRNKIELFEAECLAIAGTGEMKEINDNGLKEHFVDGSYIRELFIPANTAMVSKLWNKDRFWIIAFGDVTITSEVGTKRVRGPHTEVPVYGSKIALYTHEDTLWFAITGCKSNDSESIEKEVIVDDYTDLRYPWDKITQEVIS